MLLKEQDAVYAADKFINYFSNMDRIDEYLRNVKIERVLSRSPLSQFYEEEDTHGMFTAYDMHPEDMDIACYEARDLKKTSGRISGIRSLKEFNEKLQITTSHAIEDSVPGKSLKWMIVEKNTNTILGFCRFGSPTINSKPRNDWLGTTPDLGIFNRHAIMGFIIVPTQPFGYNYLGGKLLAMLCCTHEVRDILNKKYDANICHFETTSLYGTTKSSSQYDGLKPIMRYKGLTQSNFTPLLHDHIFKDLNKWFIERNNGDLLVKADASSRKLKTQTKMIAIIKKNLSSQKAVEFQTAIANATAMTEKKRTYFSNYGFQNVREVLLGEDKQLIENPQNFDKFYIDAVVKKWKKMATKRYNKLKECGSLRTELEVWTKDMDIDIIR
tara:strand:+ start:24 stop:1175 length:1152 start_codon:yes stop_codon:yes gene_type:complete